MDPPRHGGWVKSTPSDLPSIIERLSGKETVTASTLNLIPFDSQPVSPEELPHKHSNNHASHGSKNDPPDDPYSVEYADAVNLLGVGKFHINIALVCGFMFLAAGLQNNLNAYILPSVHCDLHISSTQMGMLNAVFLAGAISSGFLWGMVADVSGRRAVVVYGMFIDGVLTLCSSFSQHYIVLLIFRFLNGFVIGGPSSLVFAYMGEFFPDRVRVKVICYVGISWTLSWVIMPGVAWLIIPLRWSISIAGFKFNSWRLLVAMTSLPSLLSAALLLLFPESPRFLLVQGKCLQAVEILENIYSTNNNKSVKDYPVKSLRQYSANGCNGTDPKSVSRPISLLVRQTRQIFVAPINRITALASFLFFTNMFGYYGLGLWLPELFQRMSTELHLNPEAQVSLCSASQTPDNSSSVDVICDPTNVDTDVFYKSLIMGVVGLSGNVISGLLAGRLRRMTLPVILMGISGVCVLVIYFVTNMTLNLILASVFQLAIGTANLVYNSLVVDMFPPKVSGMGVSVSILAGRLGAMISNLVFGNLLDTYCSVPIFLVVAFLFAGSLVSFLIPNKPYADETPSTTDRERQEVSTLT